MSSCHGVCFLFSWKLHFVSLAYCRRGAWRRYFERTPLSLAHILGCISVQVGGLFMWYKSKRICSHMMRFFYIWLHSGASACLFWVVAQISLVWICLCHRDMQCPTLSNSPYALVLIAQWRLRLQWTDCAKTEVLQRAFGIIGSVQNSVEEGLRKSPRPGTKLEARRKRLSHDDNDFEGLASLPKNEWGRQELFGWAGRHRGVFKIGMTCRTQCTRLSLVVGYDGKQSSIFWGNHRHDWSFKQRRYRSNLKWICLWCLLAFGHRTTNIFLKPSRVFRACVRVCCVGGIWVGVGIPSCWRLLLSGLCKPPLPLCVVWVAHGRG